MSLCFNYSHGARNALAAEQHGLASIYPSARQPVLLQELEGRDGDRLFRREHGHCQLSVAAARPCSGRRCLSVPYRRPSLAPAAISLRETTRACFFLPGLIRSNRCQCSPNNTGRALLGLCPCTNIPGGSSVRDGPAVPGEAARLKIPAEYF